MRTIRITGAFLALCAVLGCASARAERVWPMADIPVGLDHFLPVPDTNSLTAAKVTIGRRLFFDTALSRDRTVACASCHDPRRAFTNGRPTATGIEGRTGVRNVPTLINRVYGKSQFWDGRAASLEQQAIEPILNPREMDMTMTEVIARLRSRPTYAAQFRSAFHEEVNPKTLTMALASYVRSILAGAAPFDRFSNGEREALSARARHGLQLFRGKANCTACHVGPTFTDERFHNTGVAWRAGRLLDEGRFLVSGTAEDRGAFKTPTLREVARTAPYMHDGSIATLDDVVEFYDSGGRQNPHLDPEIHPLHLTTEEKQALVVFLQSLSGAIHDGAR